MNEVQDIPKEKLKLLFSDILRGFCVADYEGQSLKIKHLTHFDVADFDLKYNDYFEEARKQGALNIEERDQFLIEEGSWSIAKNKEIAETHSFIQGMRETKAKLFRQQEIESINRTIKESEVKVRKLEEERQQLLQCTAESYAAKKISEYQIFKSLYSGGSLFFTEDDYNKLNDDEVEKVAALYHEKFKDFNERNFKRIALSNFFLNSFYLCKDNPFTFYGRAVVDLTLFQIEIFAHAVYFKHILSNSPSKPPQEVLNDPDKLIDFHNASKSVKEELGKGRKPEDLVGLSSKDRELLGIQSQNPHEKLIAAAKAKGGHLTSADILKVQGLAF